MNYSIPIDTLDERGSNAPAVGSVDEVPVAERGGAVRLVIPVGRGLDLDALVLIKGRGLPLVAQFHGALDKTKYAPPRYERLATLREEDVNAVLFADPTILLAESLQLAWYTGWLELDLHALIGSVVARLAAAMEASRVITTGSSGGGFAALQVAPHVPGAIAVPMNPQTAIHRYRIDGIHMGPQNHYRRIVMPQLGSPDLPPAESVSAWWAPLAHRLDVTERYRQPFTTRVQFWQNVNDRHHYEDHYVPFADALGATSRRVFEYHEYVGPKAHVQPTKEIYLEGLKHALRTPL